MRDARRPRLLLLLPTTTYRAQAFVEAARRLDADLTIASELDSAFSSPNTSDFLTLDFKDPERAAGQVKVFAAHNPVTAVFGVDDETAVVAAHASQVLGLPHNPVPAVEAAGDKYRQRVLLRECGVPVPEFHLHELAADGGELARAARYPCVLKPLHLSASRGVIRANDPIEFEAAFRRLRSILRQAESEQRRQTNGHFLVEDYVPGPEFALEGLLEDGGLHVLALFDKPDPLEGPFFEETIYVTPSRLEEKSRTEIVDCAGAAARALELQRGPVHVELRYNERGPWLIEVAARPIGGKCGQALRYGNDGSVSLEQVLLGRALGLLDEVPVREARATGVMMVPIPRAGVLREVRGMMEALSVAGISDVVITAHRGQRLVPLPEEARYLGFVFARSENPEAVERAIRAAHAQIEIVLE